jgi:hypothetical protein
MSVEQKWNKSGIKVESFLIHTHKSGIFSHSYTHTSHSHPPVRRGARREGLQGGQTSNEHPLQQVVQPVVEPVELPPPLPPPLLVAVGVILRVLHRIM